MAAPAIPMPAVRAREAPVFEDNKPRALRRYFQELDFLLNRAQITADNERKAHAIRYPEQDVTDLWGRISEYTDPNVNYDGFKRAIFKLYPGSDDDLQYTLHDLETLVSDANKNVASQGDLGAYYRKFLQISSWLIGKNRLSTLEQSRAFLRGLPPAVHNQVMARLAIKQPDHRFDDPWDLDDLHEAAVFVLHGTSFTPSSTLRVGDGPRTVEVKQEAVQVKTETISSMIEAVTQGFAQALRTVMPVQQYSKTSNTTPTGGRRGEDGNSNNNNRCGFCNQPNHYIRECPAVDEMIKAGKCRRNFEGRVILPGGGFVPRSIGGDCLRDRIEEWHRQNPGQTVTGHLMYGVSASQDLVSQFALTKSERIAALERELYALQNVETMPFTRAQRNKGVMEPERVIEERRRPIQRRTEEAVIVEEQPAAIRSQPVNDSPVHPFATAPDVTYVPPTDRTVAAKPVPKKVDKPEPNFRKIVPIHDESIVSEVYEKVMDAKVELSQRQLLSLSPELRTMYREATSAKRVPNAKDVATMMYSDTLPFANEDLDRLPCRTVNSFIVANPHHEHYTSPPPGAYVIPDHFEAFLKTLPPGEAPEELVVAKDSLALRSVLPLVDNQMHIEAIIDPGCQIIAMSENCCHELSLGYDSSITLNMQSANGDIDKSLGLARNVPFSFGDITLYLQVHIIQSPAYDILLGRPFDVLTSSVVKNFANENQTITLHDPNSGRQVTIPTASRSRTRFETSQKMLAIAENTEGFPFSRI